MSDPALQPRPGLRESITALEERLAAIEGDLWTLDGRADTHKQAAERAFSELSALRERVADAEQRLGTEHTAAGLNALRKRVGVTEDRLDEHRQILDGHAARLTALETTSDEEADEAGPDVVDAEVHCSCCEESRAERDEALRQRDSAREWVEHWRGEAEVRGGTVERLTGLYTHAAQRQFDAERQLREAPAERDARVALPDDWREQLAEECPPAFQLVAEHAVARIEQWIGGETGE